MMKKNDYINTVLKKVKSSNKQKMIEAELDDHICENSRFFEKIGYRPEIAEEKAVEAMGDAEPVSEQFENIHNIRKYADIMKDIGLVFLMCIISLFLLSIISYEPIIILFKALCALLMLYALSYKALHKRSEILTLFSFSFLIFWVIYSGKTLLFSAEYVDAHLEHLRIAVIILFLAMFNLPIIINNVFAVVYRKKVETLKNKGKDLKRKNRILRFSGAVMILLSAGIIISLSAFLLISANTTKHAQDELSSAIPTAIELADKIDKNGKNAEKVLMDNKIEYKRTEDEYSAVFYDYSLNNKYTESGIADYNHYKYPEDNDERLNIYVSKYGSNTYVAFWPGFISLHYIKTPREYIPEILTVNEEKYMDKSKEDILNTFASYNPSSLNITYLESGKEYTFSYAFNFSTYYTSLRFDNNGNILSAGTEIESW